jgi:PAS domain S-box-containing protein
MVAEQSTGELTALRAALDRMTDAFVVLDYSGRFTYVNARAREQFAPDGEPMLGRPFWEVFPTLVGSPMELEFQRVMHDPTPGTIETEVADGLWLEVRSYPAHDGISVYIRDVSEQRRTMAELDAALARERDAHGEAEGRAQQLDTIFEAVSDALVVFGADRSALRANRAMRGLMVLLGEQLSLPMTGADFDAQTRRFAADEEGQASMTGRPLRRILKGESLTGEQTIDLVVRTPTERQLHLNLSGAPIRGSDGAIVGAVESLRDVTANREAEQERSKTLSLVAHELRTPLTAIKLSLDLSLRRLQRHIPIEPSAFTVALTSCMQLERMVTDLVDAARADRQKMVMTPAHCDACEIAAQAVAEQQTTTQRAIVVATPLTPAPIFADATRIRQVLSNLLSNALKYSPQESSVKLQVEIRDESVWFGVYDEGLGVGEDAIPHLFEAFYRAPNAGSLSEPNVGLGLGLYLCKRIVDLHGGQIGMQNRFGGGSLFWFSIPLTQPEGDGG